MRVSRIDGKGIDRCDSYLLVEFHIANARIDCVDCEDGRLLVKASFDSVLCKALVDRNWKSTCI